MAVYLGERDEEDVRKLLFESLEGFERLDDFGGGSATNRNADDNYGSASDAHESACYDKYVNGLLNIVYYHPTQEELTYGDMFPVNTLRNLAIRGVTTSHYLYVDIDFWMSDNLYDVLSMDNVRETLGQDYKQTLVVPAFERLDRECPMDTKCKNKERFFVDSMPRDLDDLLADIEKKKVHVFERFVQAAHGSTGVLEWIDQDFGEIRPIECIQSNRYEPYLVVRKCDALPPFQEQFTGYGKNKISHIIHLRSKGYKLSVLGGSFLTHYPHKTSKARAEWDKMTRRDKAALKKNRKANAEVSERVKDFHRVKMDTLYVRFKEWLQELENDVKKIDDERDDGGTPLCEGADDDQSLAIMPNGVEEEEEEEERA